MAVLSPPTLPSLSCFPLMQQLLANQTPAAASARVLGWGCAVHAGREIGGIVGWMFWQGGELLVPCTDPIPCCVTQVRD